MTLNFLVHAGAVSFGFLTGVFDEIEGGHRCFAMQREDALCGGGGQGRFRAHHRHHQLCIVRRGTPPLPDIVVSNTPPASPIRSSATPCPYFCFPEPSAKSPKASCEGHLLPRGHHLPPDEGGPLTPPSTPSAVGPSEEEGGADDFGRGIGPGLIHGALGGSCHFHRHHHRRCHHHRECPRRPCRSAAAAHALRRVPWGRPSEEEPRRCLRQVAEGGAHCLRCLELTRSREERRLWKGVGHDLRKLADHFQEAHSEMERKDERTGSP
ncbi:uncharacterized protein LOC135205210 [Macrobrachium nipponense]|uniref:uncharacterized protein LOC135205210 n=1 Tax=Macrobrachium nipponense TaxID=159736 RepID=UPI0030C7B572